MPWNFPEFPMDIPWEFLDPGNSGIPGSLEIPGSLGISLGFPEISLKSLKLPWKFPDPGIVWEFPEIPSQSTGIPPDRIPHRIPLLPSNLA